MTSKEILEQAERARAEMEQEETQLQESEATQEQEPVIQETLTEADENIMYDFEMDIVKGIKKNIEKHDKKEQVLLTPAEYKRHLKRVKKQFAKRATDKRLSPERRADLDSAVKQLESTIDNFEENTKEKFKNVAKEYRFFYVPKDEYIQAQERSITIKKADTKLSHDNMNKFIYSTSETEGLEKYRQFFTKKGLARDLKNPNSPTKRDVVIRLHVKEESTLSRELPPLNRFDWFIQDIIGSHSEEGNRFITVHTIYKAMTGDTDNRITKPWAKRIMNSLIKLKLIMINYVEEADTLNKTSDMESLVEWTASNECINGQWTDTIEIGKTPILYRKAEERNEVSQPIDNKVLQIPCRNTELTTDIVLYCIHRVCESVSATKEGLEFYVNNTEKKRKEIKTARKKGHTRKAKELEEDLEELTEDWHVKNKTQHINEISFTTLLKELGETEADKQRKKRIRETEEKIFEYWKGLNLDSWTIKDYTIDTRTYKLTFTLDTGKIKKLYEIEC